MSEQMTLADARRTRDAFHAEHGRMPTTHELIAFFAIREREDKERFVGVQFTGNVTVYTYEIARGEPVRVGDYLEVWSPYTGRDELVRVCRLGRGSWPHATKVAHRVEWQVTGR